MAAKKKNRNAKPLAQSVTKPVAKGAAKPDVKSEAKAAPKAEEPAKEAPKAEEPAKEAPKAEEPAKAAPKAEEPAKAAPKAEEPAKAAPKAEEPASTKGNVEVLSAVSVATLMRQASLYLNNGDFDSAKNNCERVLSSNPDCAEAHLNMLLVELRLNHRRLLHRCEEPFMDSDHFISAMRYGDPDFQKELRALAKEAQAYQDELTLSSSYDKAMKSRSVTDLEEAIVVFESIVNRKNYVRNPKDKRLEELRMVLEHSQVNSFQHSNQAKRYIILCSIAVGLLLIGWYIVSTLSEYNRGVKEFNSGNYGQALVLLEAVGDYKDAPALVAKAKEAREEQSKASAAALRQQLAKAHRGATVKLGRYPTTSDGLEKPIEWRLIRHNKDGWLAMAVQGLDCKPYHHVRADVSWENCDLRTWLNGEFCKAAFGPDELAHIVNSNVKTVNAKRQVASTPKEVVDKLFLLSSGEAMSYFPDDDKRACTPTEYAKRRGAEDLGANCWWWLRSLGGDAGFACYVFASGAVNEVGYSVNHKHGCVRPVMRIKKHASDTK